MSSTVVTAPVTEAGELGKNPGDVWTLPATGFRGGHFAAFPVSLVERPLLATCPERVCSACGPAWLPAAQHPEDVNYGGPLVGERSVRRHGPVSQTLFEQLPKP